MMVCLQAPADRWLSCPSCVSSFLFLKKTIGITVQHALIEKGEEAVHKGNKKGGLGQHEQKDSQSDGPRMISLSRFAPAAHHVAASSFIFVRRPSTVVNLCLKILAMRSFHISQATS